MELINEKSWVCDSENYANLWLWVFKNRLSRERRIFQISPIANQAEELIAFLKSEVSVMIGYNNEAFDYPLLHFFAQIVYPQWQAGKIPGRQMCSMIMTHAQSLIDAMRTSPWSTIIRHPFIKQVDLYKINHFDNKAKSASLKLLEFNLKMTNIRELPYPVGATLTEDQIEEVIKYCINDVDATDKVLNITLDGIKMREELKSIYGMDMTNWNDPKIGEKIFLQAIQQKTGREGNLGRTPRDTIDLSEIIFPYINFNSKEFNAIKDWFANQIITSTNGVFNEISFEKLESLEGYYNRKKKNNKQENLNVLYKGFQYDFGAGGIHGSIAAGVYVSDDEYIILDVDVKSYYPNLGIKNKLYPEHLGEVFYQIEEELYNKRGQYDKKSAINKAIKLSLNGVYGKSNSVYSQIYDPKYTMTITINGQLLLCRLAEDITTNIPKAQVLQINTDGVTVRIPRWEQNMLREISQNWEQMTKLELEQTEYKLMAIKDVNNYLAIPMKQGEDNKRKGAAFAYKVQPGELELHKDHSQLVVSKALEVYYSQGIAVEEFIRGHKDIWDFFKRIKLTSGNELYGRKIERTEELVPFKNTNKRFKKVVTETIVEEVRFQKITRYYVSTDGYELVKVGANRTNREEEGWTVTECNNLTSVNLEQLFNNLNYDYYINECNKVINAINQTTNGV